MLLIRCPSSRTFLNETGSTSIIFTTQLHRRSYDPSWWYLAPEAGQHISFYTELTLRTIANKYGLRLHSHAGIHMFTDQKIHHVRMPSQSKHPLGVRRCWQSGRGRSHNRIMTPRLQSCAPPVKKPERPRPIPILLHVSKVVQRGIGFSERDQREAEPSYASALRIRWSVGDSRTTPVNGPFLLTSSLSGQANIVQLPHGDGLKTVVFVARHVFRPTRRPDSRQLPACSWMVTLRYIRSGSGQDHRPWTAPSNDQAVLYVHGQDESWEYRSEVLRMADGARGRVTGPPPTWVVPTTLSPRPGAVVLTEIRI